MTREEAYDAVAKIAAEHALIAQGFGGVITVVHPDTQRQHGIEAKCLYMAGQRPCPESPAQQTVPQPLSGRTEEQIDLFSGLAAEQQEAAV